MESGCIRIQQQISDLLLGREVPSAESIERIPLVHNSPKHREELYRLLFELHSDSIHITASNDNNIFRLRSNLIDATLITQITDEGELNRLQVKPEVPRIQSLSDFVSALEKLHASVEIAMMSEKSNKTIVHSDTPLAVASLVKVVVASIIIRQIERGQLKLNQKHIINASDISILSAGLSMKNIGTAVTVKELLLLMLFFSDNSAMDILIKIGGEGFQEYFQTMMNASLTKSTKVSPRIKPTKEIYGAAWGSLSVEQTKKIRERSLTEIRWVDGLDYFIPLTIVNKAAYSLIHSNIYKNIFDLRRDFFKGGSAPGVISALVAPFNEEIEKPVISFALNRRSSFSLVEEIYVFDSVRKLFENEEYLSSEVSINN